ncbi:Protein of unknown function [Pyronema omphalodes CBS 100304]|uniref:Uncharacterized protein n=1 Tax=Pyronema omphalodes (strain CBS 100304) TaxID=1076935 RepID=U4KV49_PYROM|nr:Protein of unknown function [Pyronema omphalodes CBS 100304]
MMVLLDLHEFYNGSNTLVLLDLHEFYSGSHTPVIKSGMAMT